MTIPSTGSISLQTIENEYGGTGQISMSEYYRGNSYEKPVSGNNTGIPQNGTIKFSQFRGTEKKRYIQYYLCGGGGGGGYGVDDGGGSGKANDGGSSSLTGTGVSISHRLTSWSKC